MPFLVSLLGSDIYIYYGMYPHKYEEGSVCSPAFQKKKTLKYNRINSLTKVPHPGSTNPDLLIPGLLFFIHLLCDLMLNVKADANKITFLCCTLFSALQRMLSLNKTHHKQVWHPQFSP